MDKTKILLIEVASIEKNIDDDDRNDVGATRSDGFAVISGKVLPVAGTSVQARERWGKITLLAVLDEMVGD